MSYSVLIIRPAQKELASLNQNAYKRVKTTILELSKEPRPEGCRKLSARDGWRIRIGDYRIVYLIDDSIKTITILHIGHRRDVYR